MKNKKIKKTKSCIELNNKKVVNLRVNSLVLFAFNNISINVLGKPSISKYLKFKLNEYSECSNLKKIITTVGFCDTTHYTCDKNFTVTLNLEELYSLDLVSKQLGVTRSECIRKIMLSEYLNSYCILPKPLNLRKGDSIEIKDNSYNKFSLRCNKNIIMSFAKFNEDFRGESNLTASLNDAIKTIVEDVSKNNIEFFEQLAKCNLKDTKNDYKYNFTVPKKRYESFAKSCECLGFSPHEVLRRYMVLMLYSN